MQFIYHEELLPSLCISGENYKYLIKVRRFKKGDEIVITDFHEAYTYTIASITKKDVTLTRDTPLQLTSNLKPFHIGWCKIDTKNIEKVLPTLNEMGVTQITFIECDRSQGNFKIKLDRLRKILINSNQQCGRTTLMQIDFCESLDKFLQHYPQAVVCDFGGRAITKDIDVAVIGCEGGFSDRERGLFGDVVAFETDLILRSESAAVAICAKVLL